MKKIRKQAIKNKTTILIPLLLLSLVLVFTVSVNDVSAAPGDTIYVNGSSGNDSWNGYTPNTAKLSIKNATGTVNAGGTVNIADGQYNEDINLAKSMNITGQSKENTIINGTGTGSIFDISGIGTNVNFQNLTLTGGRGFGAAIDLYQMVSSTVTNCIITNNTATQGVIYISYGCTLNVIDSTFKNNTATVYGGAIANYGTLNVTNSTFTNNTAISGGGIYNTGTCTLTNSTLTNNTATSTGGGIYNDNAFLTVTNSYIEKNTASGGGGLFCTDGSPIAGQVTITNTHISENTATGNGGGMVTYLPTTITDSVISSNIARYGGGILQYNYGSLTILNTLIENNEATDSIGGGIYSETGNYVTPITLTLKDCKITGNKAPRGGGIYDYNEGGPTTITNCEFSGNIATEEGGAFYKFDDEGTVALNFNRIVSNSAATGANIYNLRNNNFNAENNWWGNNDGPNGIAEGTHTQHNPVDANPWLKLEFTANPTTITQGQTSNLMANFNRNSDGVLVGDATNHIPNGTPVTFTTNLGNVGSKSVVAYTLNGIANAILRGDEAAGDALTSAALDFQTMYATVQITSTTINAASTSVQAANTIGMQTTGSPLLPLALAVLSVLGGLAATRKKQ